MHASASQTAPGAVGSRSETVRRSNLSAILRHVHLAGPSTRSELGASTGLSRSAVGTLVSELSSTGYVHETEAVSDGTPGRPSPVVRPSTGHVVLAMEVLVDTVSVAAFGLGGDTVATRRLERPRTHTSLDRTVADLGRLTGEIVRELPPATEVYGAIGGGGRCRSPSRRCSGTRAQPGVGKKHRSPTVSPSPCQIDVPIRVGNEGECGAVAVSRRGVAAGERDVVYLSGEVGVGSGVVTGGERLVGTAGFAARSGISP